MIKSRASQDRINDVLNLDEIINQSDAPISLGGFNNQIDFNNVSFKYGDTQVLNGINFSIKKGQNVALVGESGSGKTSLINLIPRFMM